MNATTIKLKRIVKKALKLVGFHHNHNHTFNDLLKRIKNVDYPINSIVDIGGNRGNWTRQILEFFPDAEVHIYEPQKRLAKYHEDLSCRSNVSIHYKGVADKPGELHLTYTDSDDSCNFRNQIKTENTEAVEVTTLDFEFNNFKHLPEICKIDAEGYDLKVLSACNSLFGVTDMFLVEAAICAPNMENSLSSVITKMDENGYKLVELTDLNRTQIGVLWLVEAVFLKRDSKLWEAFQR